METKELIQYKDIITRTVREIRLENGWKQADLAKLLGISQGRISQIENGQGSFTAEQLLVFLAHFKLPLDRLEITKAPATDRIQDALTRLGVPDLEESSERLPAERLQEALDVVRETLVGARSSRHITALAPVIVNHPNRSGLINLRAQLASLGLERRLGWALDNILTAIGRESETVLSREWRIAYRRTEALLRELVLTWQVFRQDPGLIDDILDPDIATEKSIQQAKQQSSEISRRWGIVSGIEVDDFVRTLREARGDSK